MGYGDFMDGPELDLGVSAKNAPLPVGFGEPRISVPVGGPINPFKFQTIKKPSVTPPKKIDFSKLQFRPEFGHKVHRPPNNQFAAIKPVTEAVTVTGGQSLFAPAQQDNHLKGLGDKAYSKVFMSKSHAKDVVKFYPKTSSFGGGDFQKALFVPVMFLPSTSQAPASPNSAFHRNKFTFKTS